jgi:hypothetical protein
MPAESNMGTRSQKAHNCTWEIVEPFKLDGTTTLIQYRANENMEDNKSK